MKYENITLQQCFDFEKKSSYPLICDGDSKTIQIKEAMQCIEKLSKTFLPIFQNVGKVLAKSISNLNKTLSTLLPKIKESKRYYKIRKGKKYLYKIK